jgi:GT2 family glycosyltransferase
LAACLDALEAQDGDVVFDVVVVDDGSQPHVQLPSLARAPVRSVRTPRLGAGQARNAGVRATDAPVILFTDDDVVVAINWVSVVVEYLSDHPEHVGVEGIVRSLPWDPLYEHSIEVDGPGHHWTCNIAYRREVFNAVGGFSAAFPGHREDRDLGLRIEGVGPVGFSPEMMVVHSPRPLSMRQMISRGRLVASDITLAQRHPTVFPPSRIPLPRRVMYPLWLAQNWLSNARAGSGFLPTTPRRLARFLLVASGQVIVAAWVSWSPTRVKPPASGP